MSCCADCAGQRGASCSPLYKRSVVTSEGTTGPWVHVDGADRMISIQPRWVWARPRLLSVKQVIKRTDDLQSSKAAKQAPQALQRTITNRASKAGCEAFGRIGATGSAGPIA